MAKPPQEEPEFIRQLMTAWLLTYPSLVTRKNYKGHIRKLAKAINRPVLEATEDDIAKAILAIEARGLSATYFNQILSAWRSFYNYAMRRGIIDNDPSRFFKLKPVGESPQPCPTPDEVRRMWGVLLSRELWERSTPEERLGIERDRAIMALLMNCGLRNTEIRTLKRKNFDTYGRKLAVLRKRGRIKQMKWGREIDRYLDPVLRRAKPDEYIFPARYGVPISDKQLNTILRSICLGAGTRVFAAHAFRRCTITEAIEQHGIDKAKELAGHDDLRTTAIYDQKRWERQVTGQLFDDIESEARDAGEQR